MPWIIITLTVVALLNLRLLLHERKARAWREQWEATPTMYRLEDLQAWYAEHRALEDAGLLDPDQPTPWTHALHRAAHYGNHKDKVQLRMVHANWRSSAR